MAPHAMAAVPRARACALKAGVPTGRSERHRPLVASRARPYSAGSKPSAPPPLSEASLSAHHPDSHRLSIAPPSRCLSVGSPPLLPPRQRQSFSMPLVRCHATFSSTQPFSMPPHPLLSAGLTLSVPHAGLHWQPLSSAVYTPSSAAPPSLRR
jgi:hypothetical protein